MRRGLSVLALTAALLTTAACSHSAGAKVPLTSTTAVPKGMSEYAHPNTGLTVTVPTGANGKPTNWTPIVDALASYRLNMTTTHSTAGDTLTLRWTRPETSTDIAAVTAIIKKAQPSAAITTAAEQGVGVTWTAHLHAQPDKIFLRVLRSALVNALPGTYTLAVGGDHRTVTVTWDTPGLTPVGRDVITSAFAQQIGQKPTAITVSTIAS